jgi:hypothetical protein
LCGLSLQTGTNNDDFTKNVVRFVGEERLALAVERPAALLSITQIDSGEADLGRMGWKSKCCNHFRSATQATFTGPARRLGYPTTSAHCG